MDYYLDDSLNATVITINFSDSNYDYLKFNALHILKNYKEPKDYYLDTLRDRGSLEISVFNEELLGKLLGLVK